MTDSKEISSITIAGFNQGEWDENIVHRTAESHGRIHGHLTHCRHC